MFVLATGVGLLYEYAAGALTPGAIAICAAIAIVVALGISIVSELGRNTVTSVSGLRKHLNYLVLGAAPELTPEAFRELPPEQRTPLGCLTFQPGSAFATSFRHLQGTISNNRMIAVIGSIPNEGASTSALGIAVSATQQGRSVLLVDCDLRRRSLTRSLLGDVEAGVLEAADRPNNWRDLVQQEAETGLHFLPAAKLKSPWTTLVGMSGLPILLEEMRKTYDLVVLDCAPALGSADGATLARLADGCIVVAAWDDTPMGALKQSMRTLRAREQRATGVYVNRVPPGYRFGRLRPE
ncbi:MAG: CpsD/CapB family tyrosine-protein kinase [Proteobacteria bacterium]|nr:CpsD/CapB family tyrosine-protein kinase [Pseudomonadota bacterium]